MSAPMSAMPAPTQSTISPAELAVAAASRQSTPVAPVGEPAAPSSDAQFDAGVRQLIGGALRGTPARRVAAHDQPVSTTIARAGQVPDDIKERLATDAQAEAGLALDEGEQAAKAHEEAANAAYVRQMNTEAERKAFADQQRRLQEHVQVMDAGYEQLVKDTVVKPSDWWASKDTGHKVLALLGAVMFGLAGDPKGIEKVIDDDLQLKQIQREKMLGARKSAIDHFRERLLSPEAQQQADLIQ